jgi:hypothetical protein
MNTTRQGRHVAPQRPPHTARPIPSPVPQLGLWDDRFDTEPGFDLTDLFTQQDRKVAA